MNPNDLVIGALYTFSKAMRDKCPDIDSREYVYVGRCWTLDNDVSANLYYFQHPDKKYIVGCVGSQIIDEEVMPGPYECYLSEVKPYSEFIMDKVRYLMLSQDTSIKGKTCDCLDLRKGHLVSMYNGLEKTWVKVTNRKMTPLQLANLILDCLNGVVMR